MKKNSEKIFEHGKGRLVSVRDFVLFLFTKPGFELLKRVSGKALLRSGIRREEPFNYNSWIAIQADPVALQKEFDTVHASLQKPEISIVIPIDTDNIRYLQPTIRSIASQLYRNFKTHIVCSIPLKHEIKKICEGLEINIIATTLCNNKAACCNAALPQTTGEYILFLEPGNTLTPNCLFEFIKHINLNPPDNIVYSDDDLTDAANNFSSPYFKPDWSPHSFLTRNYVGRSFVMGKTLVMQLNGLRPGFDGEECYDLLLRATEIATHIGHIPKVLFHQRVHPLPNAALAKKALQDALLRRGTPGTVEEVPAHPGCYQIKYELQSPGKVSIIIPTKDQAALLKAAIDSIISKTDYSDYEIIVLNNNSTSEEFSNLMNAYTGLYPNKFRCIDAPFPFNFSRLINLGVAASSGKYILMFNNDVEVADDNWLTQMVAYAQLKQTGAVGVKLLYPDDTIQHAGMVLGINADAGHVSAHMRKDTSGYFNSVSAATNYAAVTAACLLCRKEVFNEMDGMDETFAVEYNDFDFCLELLKHGYYNVYLPVELYHHESASRGHPFRSKRSWQQHEKELAIFKARWQPLIDNDPFYNVNLSRGHTDFRVRV